MVKYFNLFDLSQKVNYKNEVLSGLTVAIALVPEAVAFSLIAGLSPLLVLYAAFVMCLVTSILGGRPGMISGATGAVAVVFGGMITQLKEVNPEIQAEQIAQYVMITVILAGLFQMTFGFLRLGKLIRLVPHPVIFGFVNGLAIIIFMSQKAQFTLDSVAKNAPWLTGTRLYIFVALVLVSMLIIWGLPKITKVVPSALVAIVVVFGVVTIFGIDTNTVGDISTVKGGFPPFGIPDVPFNWNMLVLIFPYASIIAGVGLIESLLTLNIVDEITETRGKSNRESMAQGLGNFLSGLFGGMGGCAMIGHSLINVSNGARARLSGIVAALMLLFFVMFGSNLIEQVPMAALTGLMIMVAIGTFEWASLKTFTRMPKSDILVMVLVTLITAFLHNLALAVLIGVVVAALVFAWDNAKRIRARKFVDHNGVKHYEIYGPLFFGSAQLFGEKFDVLNDPKEVVINFAESRIVDMSAIEALNKITERYEKLGKRLHLKHLSADCLKLLKNAEKIIDVNVMVDPTYKVMADSLDL